MKRSRKGSGRSRKGSERKAWKVRERQGENAVEGQGKAVRGKKQAGAHTVPTQKSLQNTRGMDESAEIEQLN